MDLADFGCEGKPRHQHYFPNTISQKNSNETNGSVRKSARPAVHCHGHYNFSSTASENLHSPPPASAGRKTCSYSSPPPSSGGKSPSTNSHPGSSAISARSSAATQMPRKKPANSCLPPAMRTNWKSGSSSPSSTTPPAPEHQLLFFKERFLAKDHPDRPKMNRFSAKLRKQGLRKKTIGYGPTKEKWEAHQRDRQEN